MRRGKDGTEGVSPRTLEEEETVSENHHGHVLHKRYAQSFSTLNLKQFFSAKLSAVCLALPDSG